MIEKKGSRGGNARRAKLSKEQRSAIAKAGARARWDKKKAENTTITYVNSQTGETSLPSPTTELVPVVEIDPIPVIPAEPTPAEKGRMRALKEKPVSKVYGKALEIANKDYEEAAEALGIPLGTVRSRLFRGRHMLRERLSSMMDSAPPSNSRLKK